MPGRHEIAVVLIIKSDDPRLDVTQLDVSTMAGVTALRAAVLDALPHHVERVVAAMSTSESRIMLVTHAAAKQSLGLGDVRQAPAEYVAPADRKRE